MSTVINLLLILLLALIPSFISWIILQQVKKRWRTRLRRIRLMAVYSALRNESLEERNEELIEKYFIGDISCSYNAYSPHLRCAVNPDGPCENCPHYTAKS